VNATKTKAITLLPWSTHLQVVYLPKDTSELKPILQRGWINGNSHKGEMPATRDMHERLIDSVLSNRCTQ
jgi:hypothetical protein